MPQKPEPVMGWDLPAPRLTAAGWRLAALWLLAPALGVIVAADLLGWAVVRALFGACFGLVCYLG